MSSYKIKIGCTSKDDLSFDNKSITKYNFNKIHSLLQPNTIDYLDSIIILHKIIIRRDVTTKTLEFLCNRELNNVEFLDFIDKLKNCGFKSTEKRKGKTVIQLIHIKTNIVSLNCDFNSLKQMIEYLIYSKYKDNKIISDDNFIIKFKDIFNKYSEQLNKDIKITKCKKIKNKKQKPTTNSITI